MKQSTLVVAAITIFVFVGGGIVYWNVRGEGSAPPENFENLSENDYRNAVALLNKDNYPQVLDEIQKHRVFIEERKEGWEKWISLLIEVSAKTSNARQLAVLYPDYFALFDNHEKAALLTAEELIRLGNYKEYLDLRKRWIGRENRHFEWMIIDSDYLVLEGKRDEAIDLVKNKEFHGKEETDRLLRLFYMHVHDQPELAIEYLTKAWEKDSTNSHLLCMRAKAFEISGNYYEALSDYILASSLFPKNSYTKELLVDFLVRNKKYAQALDVIDETASQLELSNDLILKALFWSKVVKPLSLDFNLNIPHSESKPFIEYLAKLKPEQFWNERAFEILKNKEGFLSKAQETFWLRLIEELKFGNEIEAKKILVENPFKKNSWNPELLLALEKMIAMRNDREIDQPQREVSDFDQIAPGSFFNKIQEFVQNEEFTKDFYTLIDSPLAYSLAFLAAGWNHAAIELLNVDESLDDYPTWLQIAYSQAIRSNYGDEEALAFLNRQPASPLRDLSMGEIFFDQNQFELASTQLNRISHIENPLGIRALWLLSLISMKEGNYARANHLIRHSALKSDILGADSLGRLALAEGEIPLAIQLFRSIENVSSEAQLFLAKSAFAEKKWERARELTLKLLEENPSNLTLQENLFKILKAQGLM